jgi:hypothetical protein
MAKLYWQAKKRLKEIGPYTETGYNCGIDIPQENYFPPQRKSRATYSNGEMVPFICKPKIIKLKIIGSMTNTMNNPKSDLLANSNMLRQLKIGNAKKGYYYKNDGEDVGSISAVVPNSSFIKVIS